MYEKTGRKIIDALRAEQSAREKYFSAFNDLSADTSRTEEYRRAKAQELNDEASGKIGQARQEAADAVGELIGDLDSEEMRQATLRAMDTDYLKRLEMKLDTVGRLISKHVGADGKIEIQNPELSEGTLQAYFSEFKDDPIAIASINDKLQTKGLKVAPEDNTGKRQAHLRNQVWPTLKGFMDKSLDSIRNAKAPSGVVKAEEDAFAAYIRDQDEDFSKPYEAVLDEIAVRDPDLRFGAESLKWKFQLMEK